MNLVEIGTRVLTSCMDVKAGETVLVVTDDEKFQIGQTLYQAAKELGADAMLVTMSPVRCPVRSRRLPSPLQ